MTVQTTTNSILHDTDGVTTAWAVPFKFFKVSDLVLKFTDSSGNESTPTASITGAGEDEGGTATISPALPSLGALEITRTLAVTQDTAYPEGGRFPAKAHENALDRLVMLVQQFLSGVSRSIRFNSGDNTDPLIRQTPAQRANKLLGFDDAGRPTAVFPASGSAADVLTQLASPDEVTDGAGILGYSAGLPYSQRTIGSKLRDRNDIRDWATSLPYSVDNACAKIQAAANAFAGAGAAPGPSNQMQTLHLLGDAMRLQETLMLPAGFSMVGANKHPDAREYGDTTGGIAHPRRGSLIFTDTAAMTARRWTDIDGADAAMKPAIVLLGEGCRLENFTLYTSPSLANAADTGIHIAGNGRHRILNVDVRGGWKQGALYFDATWSSLNATMLAIARERAPWLPEDVIYDFGLTDTLVMGCRLYGIKTVVVKGSTRVSAPGGWVWAPNGISDTVLAYCQLYNEGDNATRAASGALLEIDYKVSTTANSQGFALHSCRLDSGALWVANIDHHDDLQITGGRTFCETGSSWNAYQTGQGVPTEQQRGRFNFTANAGSTAGSETARIEGEIFANVAYNGTGNVRLEDHDYRAEGGKRISYRGPRGESTASLRTDGEIGTVAPAFKSWFANGRHVFTAMEGNNVNSWGYLEKGVASWGTCADFQWGAFTVTFKRNSTTFLSYNGTNLVSLPVYSDTTASAANVQVETDGRMRRSTSAAKYKTDVQPLTAEKVEAFMHLAPISYRSLCPGDDKDKVHVGVIADQAADLGLEELVKRGDDGAVENFAYERSIAFLLAKLQEHERRLTNVEAD